MVVNFKKINKDAITPKKATDGSNGFDLTAIAKRIGYDDKGNLLYVEYDTGIGFNIPSGFVGFAVSRSSVSKMGLSLCNSCGIIDTDFSNQISFRFYEVSKNAKHYQIGDRIGQILFIANPTFELVQTDELVDVNRGAYGSTGQ